MGDQYWQRHWIYIVVYASVFCVFGGLSLILSITMLNFLSTKIDNGTGGFFLVVA